MAKIFNLVCDGNSITAGTGASNANLTAWPPVCRANLFTSQASHPNVVWNVKPIAVSGATTPQRTAAIPAQLAPLYSAAYGLNVVTFFEVRNDVNANAATLQTAIDNVIAYVKAARTAGFKTLLCTVTPTTQTTNGQNVIIPQFNTWLRANPQWSDISIVDLAVNASLSNPANLTFYNADGLHLTDAGYAVVASLVAARVGTLRENADTLGLLKQLVSDYDILESTANARWLVKVAALTATSKRLFQVDDRVWWRYMTYMQSDPDLLVTYNNLLTQFYA